MEQNTHLPLAKPPNSSASKQVGKKGHKRMDARNDFNLSDVANANHFDLLPTDAD